MSYLRPKRRKITTEVVAGTTDDVSAELPSDVIVAIDLLRAQFPKMEKVPPVALKNQVYALVADRTIVDRDLDRLHLQGIIRQFRWSGGEYAILRTEDYVNLIDAAQANAKIAKERATFEMFREVNRTEHEAAITRAQLLSNRIDDDAITVLVNHGFLVLERPDVYLFSIPNAGTFRLQCSAGRREITMLLKRQSYREMSMQKLLKKKLRASNLTVRFHVRDMQGAGALRVMDTAVGQLVRLAADALT
eukprot:TRINITY_DN4099_c0_g1_i1.p1 TRINITY_DN4099_c0_g1~~TRINITY_DN4099_c0_g1_i1.p1  ORF type:complete len:248 (+),score=54.67 TRINITY_DN4099_c0_g1_i1:52-795(+)